MGLEMLTKLLTDLSGVQIFPLQFPQNTEAAAKVEVTSSIEESCGVADLTVQVMVRDKHPALAESTSQKIKEALHQVTDTDFGNFQVVICRSLGEPFFVGESEAGFYIFSLDFNLIINKLC